MFEDPAPLRFRTLDILRTLAKHILNDLSHEEVSIQHNTGAGLVIRAFEGADSPLTGTTTKAAKKAKVANACERCRKRKTGCDGYLPCGTCVKQRHECRYAPGVSAPLRPSTASPPPHDDVPLPTPPEPSSRIQQQAFRMDRFNAAVTSSSSSSSAPVTTMAPVTCNHPSTPMASPPRYNCPTQHSMSIDPSGHFMGETSFYVNNTMSSSSTLLPTTSSVYPPLEIPNLSIQVQSMLVDYYCAQVDPFFPSILSKHRILIELDHCRTGQPSTLSPLFFYGLFARAIAAYHDDDKTTVATMMDPSLSQHLLQIALKHRDEYYGTPHFSTVLALVIIANQLEHSKLEKHLTRAWLLVGEAVRLAIDMGLHRIFRFRHKENDLETQWCIRTFWSLLVTERTMSMTYGRPSILDEKDM